MPILQTMNNFIIACFFILISIPAPAQAFLVSPIEGKKIEDFTIVNYVDWGFLDSFDHRCGSKTYDGHQGTDFVLKSFVAMDSGVNVLAAAVGEVTFIQDGLFDREKISDPAKGLGNYIAIRHANSYYTYYGHLKKNALLVQAGQMVQAGQVIAQVGSSGNSTDPHLHFELWYDSLQVVDPFQGACGNGQSLWLEDFTYESDFRIWESGLADYPLVLDSLRERKGLKACCPYVFYQTQNKPIYYWAQLIGLRLGDQLTIRWFTPANQLWHQYDLNIDRDWWYYYYWSHIDPGMLQEGLWQVKLYRNGIEVDDTEFIIDHSTSVTNRIRENCAQIKKEAIEKIEVFDFLGRPVLPDQYVWIRSVLPVVEKLYLVSGEVCFRKNILVH